MKTAVEWLADQIQKQVDIFCPGGVLDNNMIEQAKQMEKEQIEDAFEYGWSARNADSMKYGKQYYNETYKNTNE